MRFKFYLSLKCVRKF